jgi:hypothetical protein
VYSKQTTVSEQNINLDKEVNEYGKSEGGYKTNGDKEIKSRKDFTDI